MRPTIDFYFDFISPFSYLAHQRLPQLAARYGYALQYRVADLATLKRLCGNTSPRMVEMPLKIAYSRVDQKRWAERYGVPITPPAGSHDSSWLNRGAFYAADREQDADYVTGVWTSMRRDGRDLADERTWRDVARALGWDGDAFAAFVRSEASAERYRKASQEAHDRGVFGVPTMLIGKEMWWGNDRLDFLEEFLKGHAAAAQRAVS
ncbi:MAG: 2-hydroxychromene-2-carboxylate isomerase [Alphaproteobacteria bacterium]|jgi:2-hydroxychromene-2-carboxylate isomerase|nr:2-hydroxychromene-2-carboxylate isomerase [Alphaproteobacteria bacterium]